MGNIESNLFCVANINTKMLIKVLVASILCNFASSAYFHPSNYGRTSCSGICGANYDNSQACQCNDECGNYGNCCSDYTSQCSCSSRCDSNVDSSKSCQCNSACEKYGDCCADYNSVCSSSGGGGSPDSVSDNEILDISEVLWNVDVNRASDSEMTINKQSSVSSSSGDQSSSPFFSYVSSSLLRQPTYKAFINLLDNYQNVEGISESTSSSELNEQDTFLNYFMDTQVGQELYDFLSGKGLAGGSESAFKSNLKEMWFGLYSRQNNKLDSSGFEHMFVGEIKSGDVSGFHNWVQFYTQEQAGDLNYYGYTNTQEPRLYGVHFEWDGAEKPVSSTLVGSSPEYDMAIFTLCHLARPDSVCKVTLLNESGRSYTRNIQTWSWTKSSPGNGVEYVASAYFLV